MVGFNFSGQNYNCCSVAFLKTTTCSKCSFGKSRFILKGCCFAQNYKWDFFLAKTTIKLFGVLGTMCGVVMLPPTAVFYLTALRWCRHKEADMPTPHSTTPTDLFEKGVVLPKTTSGI
jgi:hypothetical protein